MRKFFSLILLGLIVVLVCFALALRPAAAGEKGEVFCRHPGCNYHTELTIGGGKTSPALTGYCGSLRQFVRIKLDSWDEYHKLHYCPEGKEILQPIYEGSQVKAYPCPRCGRRTLEYRRRLLFD